MERIRWCQGLWGQWRKRQRNRIDRSRCCIHPCVRGVSACQLNYAVMARAGSRAEVVGECGSLAQVLQPRLVVAVTWKISASR